MKNIKNQNKNYFKSYRIYLILILSFFVFSFAYATSIDKKTLIDLTNKERVEKNLQPLAVNTQLNIAAENKAYDMINYDYFEHFSPDGRSPWSFIKATGYNYTVAGENLAMDFATSEGVVKAWMASEGHRKNILRDNYEEIGLATLKGEFYGRQTTMIVQMFGTSLKHTDLLDNIIWKVTNWLLGS